MKSAAQLELQPDLAPSDTAELKQQVAQRLADHRARRGRPADSSTGAQPRTPRSGHAAEVAAAVARRYANSPSYRSVLAAESERSLQEAEAAAEVASINARAIARAQQQLLAELGGWEEPQQPLHTVPLSGPMPLAQPAAAAAAILAQQQAAGKLPATRTPFPRSVEAPAASSTAADLTEDFAAPLPQLTTQAGARPLRSAPVAEVATPSYTVRLYEDVGRPSPPPAIANARTPAQQPDEAEAFLLDEEIAFRYDPVLADAAPPEPLPANLIEFPRQLVAARKARPRLAEGPLREDGTDSAPQLRIFEVEADHIAVAPAMDVAAPEWTSILLSPQPINTFFEPLDSDYVPSLVPQTAPLARRILATLVDSCLIGTCTLAAGSLFVVTATHLTHTPLVLPLLLKAATAAGAFAALTLLYHLLFFSLADSTPGMRYARVAFCTFSDTNPSRAEVRRRLIAAALSAAPLGLGYAWALLDEDGLGWHDRISRMYLRAY